MAKTYISSQFQQTKHYKQVDIYIMRKGCWRIGHSTLSLIVITENETLKYFNPQFPYSHSYKNIDIIVLVSTKEILQTNTTCRIVRTVAVKGFIAISSP